MASISEPIPVPRHRTGLLRATGRVLAGIGEHRQQILSVFWSDFNVPHRKNVLGALWAYVMPLLPITAYILVRTVVADPNADPDDVHPAVFVVMGVMPWLLIRACMLTPFEAIGRYKTLVMNSTFPLIAAVVSGFGAVTLETLIRLAACIAFVALLGAFTPLGAGLAFLLLVVIAVFSLSLGLLLVPVLVAVPDIRHVLDIFFRYAIFFSGVIWSVPEINGSDALYRFNPFAVFIGAFRDLSVGEPLAFPLVLAGLVIATPVLFILGARTLYATEPQIKESLSR
ncbi:MAG: ABC transporter permease [Pseudomonadota bacterium]